MVKLLVENGVKQLQQFVDREMSLLSNGQQTNYILEDGENVFLRWKMWNLDSSFVSFDHNLWDCGRTDCQIRHTFEWFFCLDEIGQSWSFLSWNFLKLKRCSSSPSRSLPFSWLTRFIFYLGKLTWKWSNILILKSFVWGFHSMWFEQTITNRTKNNWI